MMDNKVLIVEDDASWYMIFRALVGDATDQIFNYVHVTDLKSAVQAIKDNDFCLILLDLMLPDSFGMKTVETITSNAPDIPIVIISTLDDEKLIRNAFDRGVEEYLIKDQYELNVFVQVCRSTIKRFLNKWSESLRADLDQFCERLKSLDEKLQQMEATFKKPGVRVPL